MLVDDEFEALFEDIPQGGAEKFMAIALIAPGFAVLVRDACVDLVVVPDRLRRVADPSGSVKPGQKLLGGICQHDHVVEGYLGVEAIRGRPRPFCSALW